jgi:hypothetical protein
LRVVNLKLDDASYLDGCAMSFGVLKYCVGNSNYVCWDALEGGSSGFHIG